MNWILIMQTVGIIIFGALLLRIAGRKSISQMTMAQVVVMIGIGTLLIQPIAGHGYWFTFLLASILVLGMIILEILEIKSNLLEKLITGQSVLVIEDGQVIEKNLKKLRLTVDKLEMRLRMAGISNITDVEWASLEVSGQLGYQLKEDKQPATKGNIKQLIQYLEIRVPGVFDPATNQATISSEIKYGHQSPPPDNLQ